MDSPVIRLTHLGGGKYDIDDVLARLSKPADAPPKDPRRHSPVALFNLALRNGSLDFVDRTVDKTHELRDLRTSMSPLLEQPGVRREVTTEPKLAFKFNGSSFDSTAQTTPFAETHKTDAAIKLTGFDLKPYLGYYIPASLPFKPLAAIVNADIKVAFEETNKPSVKIKWPGGPAGAR